MTRYVYTAAVFAALAAAPDCRCQGCYGGGPGGYYGGPGAYSRGPLIDVRLRVGRSYDYAPPAVTYYAPPAAPYGYGYDSSYYRESRSWPGSSWPGSSWPGSSPAYSPGRY